MVKKYALLFFIGMYCFTVAIAQPSTTMQSIHPGSTEQQLSPAAHVILISIDGFRPEFYLDNKWPAPNLRLLKQNGVYANGIRSVFPSVTYPSHTTIVTGAYPSKHGVYYNAPIGAKKGEWYWNESAIKVPTLWDAVHDAGKTSGSVMWPVTVGAPIDYNFPVKRADDDETADQLAVTRPLVSPADLLEQLQSETGNLSAADFNTSNTIDVTIGNMGVGIIKKYKPNLLALHFVTADHLQHELGREGTGVMKSVALIDSMIGVLIRTVKTAGLESSTTFIITGDHGFVNTDQIFSPNVLLEQNGLLKKDAGFFFHSAGGSAFLYGNEKVSREDFTTIKKLFEALPPDQRKAFRIIERAALDKAGADPEVLMALAMSKGFAANNAAIGNLTGPKKPGGTHGQFPDFEEINTGFIAFGAGIKGRGSIADSNNKPTMGIKDIAPLIAELLGLQFQSVDGRLVPGILR